MMRGDEGLVFTTVESMGFARWHSRAALSLAAATAFGVGPQALAQVSVGGVHVKRVIQPQQMTIALPLQSPPINGFVPQVIFGLTDEKTADDFDWEAQRSIVPQGSSLPVSHPPKYFSAVFDSGSNTHLFSFDTYIEMDIPDSGRVGAHTAELVGANGSEEAEISDPLGVYVTGLGNAVSPVTTALTPKSGTLRGQYNTSILTAYEDSALPNIVGSPMLAQFQVGIRNTRPHHLVVNSQPIDSPHVTMGNIDTPAPNNQWVRLTVTKASPSGTVATPTYIPSFDDFEDLSDNPSNPTFWNALMSSANGSHTGGSFSGQPFLFDTGAQVTVLSEDTASSVGFYSAGPNPSTPDFYVEIAGVGGQVDQVPGFYMQSLSISTNGGPITWNNVPVIVYDVVDPTDGDGFVPGILGMNLFTDRDLIINGNSANAAVGTGVFIGPIFRQWKSDGSGNWSDATKWQSGIPNGQNIPATFYDAITSQRTVNVDGNYTVGSMSFDNTNRYTLSGTGRITVDATGGEALLYVGSGSHTISAAMTLASDTAVEIVPGSKLTISSDVTATGRTINKSGDGTLEMKNVRAATLNLTGGKVAMLPNGGSTGTSVVNALNIGSTSRLDLSNNDLIIRNGNVGSWASPYTSVQGLVQKGLNGGTWDGVGGIITSQAAAMSSLTTLAVASATSVLGIGASATAIWSGQTVAGSDVLVMYTYAGDANLDGMINPDDYANIDFYSHVVGATGYVNGDFNYDGGINADDYALIDFNLTGFSRRA